MPKRSGSKGSRSERKAGRQRAEQAKEHGLPARPVPAPRATPHAVARTSDGVVSPDVTDAKRASRGVPTLVKVIGAALVILLGVYLLGRHRDAALTEPEAAPPGAAK